MAETNPDPPLGRPFYWEEIKDLSSFFQQTRLYETISKYFVKGFTRINASASNIQDLNNYTTGGFYYCSQNTESQYIIHCPNSNGTSTPYTQNKAFYLLCETWGESNAYTKQTLTYYDTAYTYIRTHWGDGWTNWIRIDGQDLTFPQDRTDTISNTVWAGTFNWQTDLLTTLRNRKSIIGTVNDGTSWWNVISCRHRNGASDGQDYGFYLKTALTTKGDLIWNKETLGINTQGERTLLDDVNYSSAMPKMTLKSTWEVNGGTIKFYTDGLYVYVTIKGTFTDLNPNPTNIGYRWTSFGNMPDTTYAPPVNTVAHFNNNDGIFEILPSGQVGARLGVNATSLTLTTSTMYPLKTHITL